MAARFGPWKYDYEEKNLVRINDDPQEAKNLAEKHPEIVQLFMELKAAIDQSFKSKTAPDLKAVK